MANTIKKTYQVEYNATYWVEASSEEEAIEKGIEAHAELPDGDWNAFVEPSYDFVKGEK